MDRNGQYVSDPQFGVWLARRLAIDPDRALHHQVRAIAARAKDAGTPKPLVETLPVPVFYVCYRTPPLRRAARAANGPLAGFADGNASGAIGRRRRSGISMGGAGGPC
jgi:hypothetical protein